LTVLRIFHTNAHMLALTLMPAGSFKLAITIA